MTGAAASGGRHGWIDATAGVAGDMLLGALVDAGADLTVIQHAIDLVIPESVRLDPATVTRAGQRAVKIDVAVLVVDPPHRSWRTIRGLLEGSALPGAVRDRAVAVFARLAEAEGRVHGIPPDDVLFHEVGALDSLADVIGVCAALADLGIATLSAGEVAVGSGRIPAVHGDIPVPVPAVAELAIGWRVFAGGHGELATPTGMALVTTLATACEPLPAMRITAIGVGAGTKDFAGRPNVTRILCGDRRTSPASTTDESELVLEANIDDLDPRLWPGVLDVLLRAGAVDAWLTPILMKKGRPAHTLNVLCHLEDADTLRELIFTHTSTIGLREHQVSKRALARLWCDVQVAGGTVSIKIAHRDGVIIQATPEFDTVTAASAQTSRPTAAVLADAIAAAASAGWVTGNPLPRKAELSSVWDRA